jgi:uncharacterized membrane protein SpoIIM required for sporulation
VNAEGAITLAYGFWAGSPSRMKRILTILACFLFSIIITTAGVLTPLSPEDSKTKGEELKQLQDSLKGMSVWGGAASIFENNFIICLIMFVPVVGPLYGSYVLYNTGLYVAGESNMMNVSGIIVFFLLFILPFTWFEFIAYSTALASSVWLVWRIIQRRGTRELARTGMFIAICAGLLLLGALIEAYLIVSFPAS